MNNRFSVFLSGLCAIVMACFGIFLPRAFADSAPSFLTFGITNGLFTSTFGSEAGRSYRIQASDDLLQWEDIQEITADTALSSFSDDSPGEFRHRFYRARLMAILPVITVQPQSQETVVGESAAFSVVASGTEPLTYQWFYFGRPIAGANSPSLTLTNLQVTQAGNYLAAVFNESGTAYSKVATLIVDVPSPTLPPSIRSQPASQTVNEGASVTFSVQATGSQPLSYQWRFNDAAISSETNTILVLNQVTTSQSGSYSVIVSNSRGTVASTPAALNVIPKSSEALAPTNVLGMTFQFNISAADPPLDNDSIYQFSFLSINGFQRITISGTSGSEQGSYTYAKTGDTSANLTIIRFPNLIMTYNLQFESATSGSYQASLSSPFASESGTFTITSP